MKFIDTHSHIYYDKFNHDFKDVILRAKENNISNIVCVGVDIDSSKKSIEIAEQNDFIYATVGYHPHESKDVTENYLYEIEDLIKHPKVVAVGEMGLDFYYNHSDKEIQMDVFEKQLELSQKVDKPAIIHNRMADDDMYNILKTTNTSNAVIHCFTGNYEYAKKILDLGMLLSFTGIVTFAKDLEETVKKVPLERMMIETDSPYLAPVPHRGKRNEPAMVTHIAQKISEIKNISIEEVADTTTKTAQQFFGI